MPTEDQRDAVGGARSAEASGGRIVADSQMSRRPGRSRELPATIQPMRVYFRRHVEQTGRQLGEALRELDPSVTTSGTGH